MTERAIFSVLCLCLLAAPCSATASLPPGSVTVWDRIMEEQSFINLRKGYLLMGDEKYAQAANEFLKAISENPGEPNAHILYGASLYWLGEPDRAMDEFGAAAGLDPHNAVAWQLMGIVHAWKGEFPAALEKFKKAEKFARDRGDIQMNMGSIYNSLGDMGRALSHLREAVRLEPGNPLYRFQLGLLYSRLGRSAEAKESFKKAISIFRRYEDAMLELAVLEERDGNAKEALSLYRKALEIKPGDNVARFRLACLLYSTGDNQGLKKLLNEAFLLTPSNDKGGISINLSYAGGKKEEQPPDGGPVRPLQEDKPSSLENTIRKIPADEDISIQAEIISVPKTRLVMRPGEKPGGLKSGLERNFSRPQVSYLKREYSLPASDSGNRAGRAAQIASEIEAAVKAAGGDSDTRMSLSIETRKASAAAAGNRDAKVVFKPRDVGNDMGLWVVGNNWIENVEEALDDLSSSRAAPASSASGARSSGGLLRSRLEADDGGLPVLKGFGRLILGEADAALEEFRKTGSGLEAIGELGSCAAWVEKGSEEKALAACLEALKREPSNKTALANKKWLERADARKGTDMD